MMIVAPRLTRRAVGGQVFGIGLPELIIIVLVALVLLKPKDLPAQARRLGSLVRRLKGLRDQFARTIHDAEREVVGDVDAEVNAGQQGSPDPRKAEEASPPPLRAGRDPVGPGGRPPSPGKGRDADAGRV